MEKSRLAYEQRAAYEKWEHSYRISLMIMKGSITTAIRGAILDSDNAKMYLAHIEEQFQGSSKAHATTLITKMVTLKYSGSNGVREHILRMNDMASQLKGLDMEISEGFLVHFIMTSLPAQFGPFKINYNTQIKKWKMSELISMCVQEEERLKSEQPDSAHVAITSSSKGKGKGKKFGKSNVQRNTSASVTKTGKASSSGTNGSSGPKCHFYDILLASSDMHMLHKTKKNFMSNNFDMKDLGEASYVIGIEIHRDRSRGILGLSQRAYIDKVLKRFNMHNCASTVAPVVKGDKFSLLQCPRNQLEQDKMERIPYASAVGSLKYAQVCTRPDIVYVVGMLRRYQINPGMGHWKAAKKVMRYLQDTKDFMFTYRKSDNLELGKQYKS
ncbi:hypothetical protein RJ640_000976 [Escallonia rubra]|uniref:Reverse transcriptase Ty1/copia-type domain-containing protein n=1 Tax=Escallonia rubra TaxID=112253 RepID=A0AA88UB59_9ASTE|nr:hypothetical protein RJ640_000976 [Escallonia rubra]